MPEVKKTTPKIKKALVIGSGPIVIGQSAEFDYSGSQACQSLREEGVKVVLVNSNPATIQTDNDIADIVYIEPLLSEYLEKKIEKEKPDGIIATMGGQTGLNLCMELHKKGVLQKHNVQVLGTPISAIELAEDRGHFAHLMEKLGEPILSSIAAKTKEEAYEFAKKHSFPLILRPAYTLGGTGGGIAYNKDDFEDLLELGFTLSPTHQILIEESVLGWAEFEYELMRDSHDNCISICNMENVDPMGIHTGESVVVAPSQTLSDREHQTLRDAAFRIIRAIGIVGGCNIQFAVDQKTGKYVIVEVNPRLSRSSALASKATGYPIARVAAKIALGKQLYEIKNAVTKTTPASFEPALDYVVVKIPRWPFDKMSEGNRTLGTQMKSTGEAMAIGRTFEEAFNKAMRSREVRPAKITEEDLVRHIKEPTDLRFDSILYALRIGWSGEKIHSLTNINPWFVQKLQNIIEMEKEISATQPANAQIAKTATMQIATPLPSNELLLSAKRMGFSDSQIASLCKKTEGEIRTLRKKSSILPTYKIVDTCAGEFDAKTPYYYSTYEKEDEKEQFAGKKQKVIVIGSGPIRIGQGIEFDYCCCHASFALRAAGFESIMINNNPETISTDFDTSDRLYFEPLTFEDVLNIVEREKPIGVIVQFGGQTSINLAGKLTAAGVKILGTQLDGIDIAEDRERFRELLHKLKIAQPENGTATNLQEALAAANKITYPIVVRPSYVIAGRGMQIVYDDEQLTKYIAEAVEVSESRPVLIDKYIEKAIECEIDGICDGKRLFIGGIMEHIERAGVHSGDASCVTPPVRLKKSVQQEIVRISNEIALALSTIGAINIQYVVRDDIIYVLEANPRASRTMPYLSKAIGIPLAKKATLAMLGKSLDELGLKEQKFPAKYAVKSVVFPFLKLRGVDFILGPEMKSTGESMGADKEFSLAFYKALLGANQKIPLKGGVVFSLKDGDKERVAPVAALFSKMGFEVYATPGTAKVIQEAGISVHLLQKIDSGTPNISTAVNEGKVQLIINTPKRGKVSNTDGFRIRRLSIEKNIPCITNFEAAEALASAIERAQKKKISVSRIEDNWN
ncbi:Pyruvate carboxylase subunit A [Candidatus Anstonella stagnisolia]|nr:Pyruvate carboxylase subunit A [Candidatus Anstonella stagnisolia]